MPTPSKRVCRTDRLVLLADLEPGTPAVVVEIVGGRRLYERLQALGIRVGAKIRRVGGGFGRGPVVVEAGDSQFAVGCGMAQSIIVEIENAGPDPAGR